MFGYERHGCGRGERGRMNWGGGRREFRFGPGRVHIDFGDGPGAELRRQHARQRFRGLARGQIEVGADDPHHRPPRLAPDREPARQHMDVMPGLVPQPEFSFVGLRAALEALVRRTRRYASYQRKWMRRIPGLVSLNADRPAGEIADAILEVARARQRLPAGRAG